MGATLPTYAFHPNVAFPETVGVLVGCKRQNTNDCERPLAGLVLAICNLMKTGAPSNDLTVPQFLTELTRASDTLDVPLSRLMDWAESVFLDPTITLTDEEMKAVPLRNISKNFALHDYQRTAAGWSARRLGSVLALGCGVGKTATAVAAVIAAKRLGRFKGDRVYVVCPLNAMGTWRKVSPDLEAEFSDVQLVSIDSLHLYKGLTVADGGALIVDECFPGHVRVETDEGPVTFSELAARATLPKVLTRDAQGNEYFAVPTRLVRNPNTRGLLRVWYGDQHVDCTPDHPVWTEEEGYLEVGLLRVGHHHLRVLPKEITGVGREGPGTRVVRVDRVEVLEPAIGHSSSFGSEVYCLEVEGTHCFFADRVLVHNCHKAKHEKTGRTREAHELRRCFEWGVCLTGSLLHTGPEGLMSILDLACPGLSRFLDKWAFGEAFACIAEKVINSKRGRVKRHALIIPSEEIRPILARYLERAARSLSFASPEVEAIVKLPGQMTTMVDTWEKPDWVLALEADCRTKIEAAIKAPMGAPQTTLDEVVWAPNTSVPTLMGSLAVCIMEETREEILEVANAIENTAITSIDDAVLSIQGKLDDPFYLADDEVWSARRKGLQALIKNPGLPSFNKVIHAACRLGRYDQVIVKTSSLVGGLKTATWKFRYGPGHNRKDPGIGPKSRFVLDWLADNPNEPLVAGAAGTGSISVLAKALESLGITYRVIRGGVPSKKRDEYVDEFNAGNVRVMLLQQVAGSESIDLVRAANSMLVDHDWGASIYSQFLARTSRQGQTRECTHYDMSFTCVQTESILRLLRGQDFDAKTRALLEQQCNMNASL